MLRPKAILETFLYAEDLEATSTFYKAVLHLAPVHIDNRMCALRVSEENFLLLFKAGAPKEAIPVPGGEIPPHDGDGPMHVAFSINPSDVSLWTQHLQAIL
jgi:catechol-2,3-dioxygenase